MKPAWAWPAVIVLGGLALRMFRLDFQDVWFDEAFSITASVQPLARVTEALVMDFVHPPLHSYLLHYWLGVLGVGDFQGRLLSVAFGTLAIVMIYFLAKYLFDRRTAILAAFLLAVSHLGVMYSQEARPYAQFLFLVLATTYLLVRALRERRTRLWWMAGLSAVAMLYTHYYGWAVFGCLALFVALVRKRYAVPLAGCVLSLGIALAAYLPWLATGVLQVALRSEKIANHAALPSTQVYFWSAPSALNWFNNGKFFGVQEASPWWTFLAGGLLFTVPALVALVPLLRAGEDGEAGRKPREALILLGSLWLLAFVLMLVSSLARVQFFVRYVAFAIGPYYVLAARGIAGIGWRGARVLVCAAILLYNSGALRSHYTIPYKGQRREALAYMASQYRDGDCTVFESDQRHGNVPLQWQIYQRDLPPPRVEGLDAVASGQARCGRVWFVWSYPASNYRDQDLEEHASSKLNRSYQRSSTKRFARTKIELFLPKQP